MSEIIYFFISLNLGLVVKTYEPEEREKRSAIFDTKMPDGNYKPQIRATETHHGRNPQPLSILHTNYVEHKDEAGAGAGPLP